MKSPKDEMLKVIGEMPDDSSLDEILRQVEFVAQVMAGVEDADAGRLLCVDELLTLAARWDKKQS